MSFNRTIYDPCAYNKRLDENSNLLTYTLDPNKHYNCKPCAIPWTLGGNVVSIQKCNLVDVESDLRNITRLYSTCPEKKYLPSCKPNPYSQDGLPCSSESLSCNMSNLPECAMIYHKPRINNVGYELNYPACPNKVNCAQKQGTLMRPPCQKNVRLSMAPTQQGYAAFYKY